MNISNSFLRLQQLPAASDVRWSKRAVPSLQTARNVNTRHRSRVCPYMRYPLICCLFLVLAFAISFHSLDQPDGHQFHTSIAPVPGENLAGPCRFDLWIPDAGTTLNATWITYDRGFDISKYFGDSDVRAFAEKHRIALMMAHQCPAKAPATGEMDMDLSHGIARTIFAALKDFAEQSGQNELSNSKLLLVGFSRTGVLFARLIAFAPERIVAAILAAPGQGEPFAIEHIDIIRACAKRPSVDRRWRQR